VAAGGADLKVVAGHIRTADANPDDLQASLGSVAAAAGLAPSVCSVLYWPQLLTRYSHVALLQEGDDTMLVGGGGAARTIGSLLQKLAAAKGEEAAKEAWQATGEQLAAFLPQADREDKAALTKLAEQYGLQAIAC